MGEMGAVVVWESVGLQAFASVCVCLYVYIG